MRIYYDENEDEFWTPQQAVEHASFLRGIAIATTIGVFFWVGFFWLMFKVF